MRLASLTPYSRESGVKVLGIPIHGKASTQFVRDFLEEQLAKQQKALDRLAALPDAQAQHAVHRYCLDACKLQWFLRTAPCLLHPDLLRQGDNAIRSTLSRIIGSPLE